MRHGKSWVVILSAGLALVWRSATGASHLDAEGARWGPPTLIFAEDQPAIAASTTEGSVVFRVPTITCPSCPLRVEASIRKAPGILDVSFNGQDVTVTYDPSAVSPDAIEAAIEAGGDIADPLAA